MCVCVCVWGCVCVCVCVCVYALLAKHLAKHRNEDKKNL